MPAAREGFTGNSLQGAQDIYICENRKYSVGSGTGKEAVPISNTTHVFICAITSGPSGFHFDVTNVSK